MGRVLHRRVVAKMVSQNALQSPITNAVYVIPAALPTVIESSALERALEIAVHAVGLLEHCAECRIDCPPGA